ncbi:MAG: gliding motility-associated C-terminal domain-containing protein [Sphingobacteriaceae bacterium]|nr:gliding motility-associated C-terminal domain-containing protein [Sphingobacteriaceae bacterium]
MKKVAYIFLMISFLSKAHTPSIIFKENKGQWPEKVLFGADIFNTQFYINKNSFNYCIYSYADLKRGEELHHTSPGKNSTLHGHNYEVNFVGADLNKVSKTKEQPEYYNYFLGNNRSKWASNIKAFEDLLFNEVYEGIDLKVYSNNLNLKYDFIVKPNANVNSIKLNYNYTDGIEIINNELVIKTSVGNIIEQEPFAYQIINGKQNKVNCKYTLLNNNTVGFTFPNGYNKNYVLVIDPTVIVCSYSGSTKMMFGCAAGYDDIGNIYVTSCGREGYPTTTGAFSQTYYGGYDIVVSAYNSVGTSKIFSTYIGGDSLEYFTTIKVKNNEIIMAGSTASSDFPTPVNTFDSTSNGRGDIIISKLDMSGSNLLASTYIGGSGDESNWSIYALGAIGWDALRNSDFIPDTAGNVYMVGITNSTNFPVSSGAISTSLTGTTDGYVLKMDKTLSNLVWSTFLGGNREDAAKSIKLDGTGGAYILGITSSTTFPTTSGVISPTKNGAAFSSDMFVSHINSNGTALIASTYLGTTGYDYGSYMDLDFNNNIYICGHITSPIPLVSTPGVYNNNNGFNTLYKINSNLSTIAFKTKFGNQPPPVNPAPSPYLIYSAFRVDSCQNIYVAGYAENILPVTSNQLMPFAGGITDVYMAVFGNNCSSLKFASYFGGSVQHYSIGEHNDYSSSDFDSKGRLYMSICNNGGLPTTPGAFVQTYVSPGDSIYNDAFLKVDLQTFINAGSSYGANITGCPPFTPTFVSTTNTGSTYWDLGNGVTSIKDTVSTTYTNLGTYNVLLLVTDTTTCNRTDSIKSFLNVINPTEFDLGDDILACFDSKTLLKANVSAVTYSWSTGQTFPNIYVNQLGSYTLTINNGGCNTSDVINVVLGEIKLSERFPNVITPNGDNINDWIDFINYNFDEIEFYLYDRWGRERYKITKPDEKWNPADLDNGTYYYVANYKSSCTGKFGTDKGFISVFK